MSRGCFVLGCSRQHPLPRTALVPAVSLFLWLGVVACATPTARVEVEATALGLRAITLAGTGFRHAAWYSPGAIASETLHVYIDHDGSPWIGRSRVAADPTPRSPLALRLMARDANASLYLGRPCYFASNSDRACGPLLWTHHRYSESVVDSMAEALESFRSSADFRGVVLIGYSGGGTLARLVAERLPSTRAVVTLAANLDTDRWTELHGYSALAGSLNPAAQPALGEAVREVHYVGREDRNVPPQIARSYAVHHRSARIIELPGFDHRCCWLSAWPALLERALVDSDTPPFSPDPTPPADAGMFAPDDPDEPAGRTHSP